MKQHIDCLKQVQKSIYGQTDNAHIKKTVGRKSIVKPLEQKEEIKEVVAFKG